MRYKLATAILILCVSSAFGQTASEIEARYGEAVDKAYSVGEHVWMALEYATDGQACRMRLYPKGIPSNPGHEFVALPYEEVKDALNQLVPLKDRGMKLLPLSYFMTTGGGVARMVYPYEKVTFTFYFLFRLWPGDPKELKAADVPAREPLADRYVDDTKPADDDFSSSKYFTGDLFTIEWKDRKCVGK